ncbi:RND transporter [[Phormidium ambiguum] IAM M-71]|uniref:RND transporter n=1 Tax=[Phormidium ambiguum] IAM M-71 TaxID=454136 RepID=A0A1U7IRK4_9CYAN|nr:efflux RND transporter permease subunit [Phormidium ambiguum]OKH40000.1 RND transporter [Phormidium ambiguum IAM M-71]
MAVFSISDNFIKRPVLTTVCTILIVLIGTICIPLLPINNLPDIAPIQIQVNSTYSGADAQTVADTVTTTLERQINGVEGLQFITSQSTSSGASSIQAFFGINTDRNINQVNVQNQVALAQPQLPDIVRQNGVSVRASSTSILLVYGFNAENNKYDDTFISNYLDLYVTDTLRRVPGVGDLTILGQRQYAMRIWLDPNRMAARQLTPNDVIASLQAQNVQVGVGRIGSQPAPADQAFSFPVRVQGRFRNETEFGNLILRVEPNGSLLRLRDVGRVELGAENYDLQALVDGQPGVGIAIYQLPGSNAVDIAARIKETMAGLEKSFPPGLKSFVVYDITEFIETSLQEVFSTLIEAILLVILIIFIFLQDWRTTIIPAIAIPVSLLGTMGFTLAFGFSLNTLTMFALILATGLVVDDGIVVVEAVAGKMEQGMSPRQAALQSMSELAGAVVSTSLVLIAVFLPVTFFPGATGIMYQQFALVIIFSIVVSTFNALTFSPTMAALLLRPKQGEGRGPLAWFFRQFNRVFAKIIAGYAKIVKLLIKLKLVVFGIFIALLAGTVLLYMAVPTGFIPEEDQGLFLGIIQSPEGVALNYTNRVAESVYQELKAVPEIEESLIVSGFGLNGSGPSRGTFFVKLKNWAERTKKEQSVKAILLKLNRKFTQNQQALIQAFNLPPVPGFSATGGFEFQLQDQSGGQLTFDQFLKSANDIIAKANQNPNLSRVFTQFTANTPQLEIDINRDRLASLNIDFAQAMTTLGTYIGGRYVNDFSMGQRNYRVLVQADEQFRSSPEDLGQVYVRSRNNQLVQLKDIATIRSIVGPSVISNFNLFRSINIQGNPAPGKSSGQAIQAMDQVFRSSGISGLGYEWSGLTREEIQSGGQAGLIMALGLVIVFLVLAAQYENYIDPLIILLTVPMAVFGAMLFISLDPRELVNDLYCQIALVMLIGLASKNAILIVEFANQSRESLGMTIPQAAANAAKERFRPILMTACSTLVGFWPLVVASGASSASRWSLGVAVFGGFFVATIMSFFLVPVLYVVIKQAAEFVFGGKKKQSKLAEVTEEAGIREEEKTEEIASQTSSKMEQTPDNAVNYDADGQGSVVLGNGDSPTIYYPPSTTSPSETTVIQPDDDGEKPSSTSSESSETSEKSL